MPSTHPSHRMILEVCFWADLSRRGTQVSSLLRLMNAVYLALRSILWPPRYRRASLTIHPPCLPLYHLHLRLTCSQSPKQALTASVSFHSSRTMPLDREDTHAGHSHPRQHPQILASIIFSAALASWSCAVTMLANPWGQCDNGGFAHERL